MNETAYQRALRCGFAELVGGISAHAPLVASRAYSKGLIGLEMVGSASQSASAYEIAHAINKRITSDRTRQPFEDLLEVLEAEPSTAHLAKMLRESEAQNVETHSMTRSAGFFSSPSEDPERFLSPHLPAVHDHPRSSFVFQKPPKPPQTRRFHSNVSRGQLILSNGVTTDLQSPSSSHSPPKGEEERNMVFPRQRSSSYSGQSKTPSEDEQRAMRRNSSSCISIAVRRLASTEHSSPSPAAEKEKFIYDTFREVVTVPAAVSKVIPPVMAGKCHLELKRQFSVESSVSTMIECSQESAAAPGEHELFTPKAFEQRSPGKVGSPKLASLGDECVGDLLKQLEDLQERRQVENSEAFRIHVKSRLLKKQIRCMEKEKKKVERRLQETNSENENLQELTQLQMAEIARVTRKCQLMECELQEVSTEVVLLEERQLSLQIALDEFKTKEERCKAQLEMFSEKLRVAVERACSYREENITLKARIETLESLIDRFRKVKFSSSGSKDYPEVLLKKSFSI